MAGGAASSSFEGEPPSIRNTTISLATMAASIRPMRRRSVQAEGPDRTGGISVRGRAGRREPASLRRISVFVPGEGLPYRVSRCENGLVLLPQTSAASRAHKLAWGMSEPPGPASAIR